MKGFLGKAMLKIIIPAGIADFLFWVLNGLSYNHWTRASEWLAALSVGDTHLPYSWFVIVISIFYLLFWVVARVFEHTSLNSGAAWLLTAVIACYIYLLESIGLGDWWYRSCAGFIAGILVAQYREKLKTLFDRRPVKLLIYSTVLFSAVFVALKLNRIGFLTTFLYEIASFLFCILIIFLTSIIKIGNRLLLSLSRISYEVYLYQGFAITFLPLTDNYDAYVYITITITILLAIVMNLVNRFAIFMLTDMGG